MIHKTRISSFGARSTLGPLLPALARMYPTIQVRPYEAQWSHPDGATTVVRECVFKAATAQSLRSVTVETTLNKPKGPLAACAVSSLNQYPGIGALHVDAVDNTVRLRTAIRKIRPEENLEKGLLLVLAASMHAEFAQSGGIKVVPDSRDSDPFESFDDDNPWSLEEFEAAGAAIKARCRHVYYNRKGLISSFRFGKDDVGHDPELQIESGRSHPLYGLGLQTALTLPWDAPPLSRLEIAARLNQLEYSSAHPLNTLGAWSAPDGRPALTYRSFLPSRAAIPLLVTSIALESLLRSVWAFQRLPK
jgi:hypothetical protein